MLKNYCKVAWRNITLQKGYSLINIFGLAVGIACCLIILLWVQDELSYDKFHRNGDRIFRVVSDWTKNNWQGYEGTPPPLGPALRTQLPEVENMARFAPFGHKAFRYKEKSFYEDRGIIIDPSFFAIFSFPFVQGSRETALKGSNQIVITETMARKYFGAEDPMDKVILVEGEPKVIRGVLRSIPRHSTLQFEYALSSEQVKDSPGWGAFNATTFLLLRQGTDVAAVAPKITDIGIKNKSPQVLDGVRFRLQPLRDIHLDARAYQIAAIQLGDSKYIFLFSVIALFVLIVACINFVNLSLARSGLRAKEVGLRKVIGAGRPEIIRQFFGESLLFVLAAVFIALILVQLFIPAFNRLSGKFLSGNLLQLNNLPGLVALILAAGLLAGTYPALILSRFQPAKVLKGDISPTKSGGAFRKILVVFQFSLSIVLLIAAVVAIRQFRFMRDTRPGYDKDNIVQIPVKENIGRNYAALKQRLLQSPAIRAVTAQQYSFAEWMFRSAGNWDWEGRNSTREIDIVYRGVDEGFFAAMGIPLAAGRSFSRNHADDARGAVMLNEQAIRDMGIKDPIGKWFSLSKDDRRIIVGVARDTHFQTYHYKQEAEIFFLVDPARDLEMGLMMIRINGEKTPQALAHIKRTWEEFNFVSPFEFQFLDEVYDRLYRSEYRMSFVFTIFAGLAILIAFLGLLGLTMFVNGRRKKEISIRKILGASTPGIILMISRQLAKWILAANILAWPVTYFAMSKLLQEYAFRVTLHWTLFVFPSLGVFLLASLLIALQSMRTATTDPAATLRYE